MSIRCHWGKYEPWLDTYQSEWQIDHCPPLERPNSTFVVVPSSIAAQKNFTPTAFYQADIKTDENGRASVTVPMPKTKATYRILAIAAADGKFGVAESKISCGE